MAHGAVRRGLLRPLLALPLRWPRPARGFRRHPRRGARRRRRAAAPQPRIPRPGDHDARQRGSPAALPPRPDQRPRALVPGLQRARRRVRPCLAAHHRNARRRRVRHPRTQDLDELLRRRRLVLSARAHRPRRPEAQGALRLRRADAPARHRAVPAPHDQRHHQGVWPGRVRRRARPRREHDRQARRRLAYRDDDRQPRAGARRGRLRRAVREDRQGPRGDGARESRRVSERPARGGRLGVRAGRDAPAARAPQALRASGRTRPRSRWLHRQGPDDVGRANGGSRSAVRGGITRGGRRRRRRTEDLPLQPGPERDGRHLADPEEHHRHADPRPSVDLSTRRTERRSMDYSLPQAVRVETDGPVRIVRLARPEQLNAVNDELHLGLTRVFPLLSADSDARVAVITGEGRAFSAGGAFHLLARLVKDRALRRDTIAEGRELVLNMIRCRVPVVAAVNGPAVGLGCSVIALSDVVYMAESAYLSDPHVPVGLVAADGGPLTWPRHTSLLLAKEYAFTGDRISAARAREIGLANHVCPDGEVLSAALAAARRIASLPRQAVEATKRVLNLHVERAVLATIDFAMAAETESFETDDLRANVLRFLKR